MHLDEIAEAKFWGNVTRTTDNECWPWTGGTIRHGRGVIWFQGKNHIATHIALALKGLPRPSAKSMACHTCDNPNCVNPAHLWWGSSQENMADCVSKGRHASRKGTHCIHGHEWTAQNTYAHASGDQCRTCFNLWRNKWRARKRAEGVKRP
jgi:hypothetical protein